MTKFFPKDNKTIVYTTITSKQHRKSCFLYRDTRRQSYSNFLTIFCQKSADVSKIELRHNFFLFQNDLCMTMYCPTKFQVNWISFRDFMDGGMFCPPPRFIIDRKSPAQIGLKNVVSIYQPKCSKYKAQNKFRISASSKFKIQTIKRITQVTFRFKLGVMSSF